MPENKEIQIRAKIDTTGVDQQLQSLQQKLNQMQRMSGIAAGAQEQYGAGSKMSGLTKSFFGDFNQESIRNLREVFNLNSRKLQNEEREMRKKEQEMRKIEKIDKAMTEGQKQRLKDLKDEIDLIKQKGRATLETQDQIARQAQRMGSDLSGFKGVGGRPEEPQGPGMNLGAMGQYRQYRGMGFGKGTSRAFIGIGGAMGALGVIGGLGALGTSAMDIWQEQAMKRGDIAMAEGAAAGVTSRTALEQQNPNQILQSSAFMQERAKALGIVGEELKTQRGRDIGSSVISGRGALAAAGAHGLGLLGAKAGGAIGTFIAPGIGTAIGAGIGYAGGAALGYLGLSGEKTRGALLGTEEYKQQMTAQSLARSQAIEEKLRLANIPKNLAFQAFQQRVPDIMKAETAFGAEAPQQQGGFLRSLVQAGMTGRTGMGIAEQMQRQGGITSGAGNIADIRQSYLLSQGGLGNAGQLTGAIRGLAKGFGEQATENSIKKLFSEAVKFGVNDSKMVEEMRQFSGAAINLAMERGIRVEEAAGMISRSGMAKFSLPNLKAAQTALQMREQAAQEPGSMAFKMGFMATSQGQDMFGGLNRMSRLRMASLKPTDISRDNPEIQQMIEEMGLEGTEAEKFEEFQKRYSELELRGIIKHGPTLERIQQFKEAPQEEQEKMMGDLVKRIQVLTGGKQSFRTIQSLIQGRAKPTGAGENLMTQARIDEIPELLRRPGLTPEKSKAETMFEDSLGRGKATIGARLEEGRAGAEEQAFKRLTATDMETGKEFTDLFLDNMKNAASGSSELVTIMSQMTAAAGQSTEALSSFARVINAFGKMQQTGSMEDFQKVYEQEKGILEQMGGNEGQPTTSVNTRGGK